MNNIEKLKEARASQLTEGWVYYKSYFTGNQLRKFWLGGESRYLTGYRELLDKKDGELVITISPSRRVFLIMEL